MKKIIKNKVYDTEKAKQMGLFSPAYAAAGDFENFYETLYQKRTGEFFLHGKGGAASKYAEYRGNNSWSGGESIMPLTYDQAKEWAEEKLEADDYEAIFGKIVEDETKTNFMLSLKAANVEKIKRHAQAHGVGVSELIDSWIESL